MHWPEARAIAVQALEQRRQPDRLGMKHRTAAIARESVARAPDNIDIAGTLRDALFEDSEALVDERIQTALENLLLAMRLRCDLELPRAPFQDLDRLGIIVPGAIPGQILVVALAVFLPQTTGIDQREIGLVVGRIGRVARGVGAVHVDADIDAGHV